MSGLASHLIRLPRLVCLFSAALYMGGIYILSSLQFSFPDSSYPFILSFLGNLFHLPLYTGLGFLLLLGFRRQRLASGEILGLPVILLALGILALYGAFDEYHQSWTGRTPSFIDFFMDINGGLLASLIMKSSLDKTFTRPVFICLVLALTTMACGLAWAAVYY